MAARRAAGLSDRLLFNPADAIVARRAAYSHSSAPRRLVIVLDGVPYQTIAELRAEGRFRRFKNPARMISMFPSLTNVAMIEILQAGDSPGYEDHYYDRDRNRLLGTIQDRLNGGKFIQGTFRETFDYHAPAFKGSLAYLAAPAGTIAVAHLDLSAFRKAFRNRTRRCLWPTSARPIRWRIWAARSR